MRIDNIILFNRLNENDIEDIVRLRLDEIRKKHKNIDISFDDNLIKEIVLRSDFYDFGARKIEKIISKNVENVIIDAIINNEESIHIESLDKEKNITILWYSFYGIRPQPVTTYLPPWRLAAAGGLLYSFPFIVSDDDWPPSRLAAL